MVFKKWAGLWQRSCSKYGLLPQDPVLWTMFRIEVQNNLIVLGPRILNIFLSAKTGHFFIKASEIWSSRSWARVIGRNGLTRVPRSLSSKIFRHSKLTYLISPFGRAWCRERKFCHYPKLQGTLAAGEKQSHPLLLCPRTRNRSRGLLEASFALGISRKFCGATETVTNWKCVWS